MKVEARLFFAVAIFLWLSAIAYGIWTAQPSSFTDGKVEPVGVAALLLSGGLLAIPGSFFWFVSRRIEARPEDRDDAEIAEAAGEYGFFSPGSYWPVTLAATATVAGIGLALDQMWLLIVGVLLILFGVGGLVFEYYYGNNSAEH